MRLFFGLAVSMLLVLLACQAPQPARAPQAAQAPQPGWIADPRTGCRVWSKISQPQVTIAWSGRCVGGLAQGSGVLQFDMPGQPTTRYEGVLRDGKPDGRGVATFSDGDRYEGEWRNGTAHGRGLLTFANGDRYEGEYRDGHLHGLGVSIASTGERDEGEWGDGIPNGRGILTRPNGDRYEGEWHGGCLPPALLRHAALPDQFSICNCIRIREAPLGRGECCVYETEAVGRLIRPAI